MTYSTLNQSVGIRDHREITSNLEEDKKKTIGLLASIKQTSGGKKEVWSASPPSAGPNGMCPPELDNAIWAFQKVWKLRGEFKNIDGAVDPGLHTLRKMNELAEPGVAPPSSPLILDLGAAKFLPADRLQGFDPASVLDITREDFQAVRPGGPQVVVRLVGAGIAMVSGLRFRLVDVDGKPAQQVVRVLELTASSEPSERRFQLSPLGAIGEALLIIDDPRFPARGEIARLRIRSLRAITKTVRFYFLSDEAGHKVRVDRSRIADYVAQANKIWAPANVKLQLLDARDFTVAGDAQKPVQLAYVDSMFREGPFKQTPADRHVIFTWGLPDDEEGNMTVGTNLNHGPDIYIDQEDPPEWNVLAHEFGHSLGLDHVPDPENLMFKSANNSDRRLLNRNQMLQANP